ncbi:MAG: transglycosylase domain-containing protein [Ruminococcus sp.]|nr:transglycosylase domain-containing protein [Ruminococcus sp.]
MDDKNRINSTASSSRNGQKSKINTVKRKKKKTNPFVKVLKVVGTLLLAGLMIVIISGSIFATALTIYILNFADTTTTVSLDEDVVTSNVSRFLYENPDYDEDDSDSEEYLLYYGIRSTTSSASWVDLEEIPTYVQDAFVYTEDERFYSHDGVDFRRTFIAIVRTLLGDQQGGSTITQQTIKNITDDNATDGSEGVERKIREIFRAINVEKVYTKDEILQTYLNVIEFGTSVNEIIGIQAAANFYFKKDVSELSLAEAASLAGMLTAPAYYNPLENPENNLVRLEYCLDQMLENGAISDDEYDEAMEEAQNLEVYGDTSFTTAEEEQDIPDDQGATSWFMDAAIRQAIEIIADEKGVTLDSAEEMLYSGGYTIYTTVDIEMQEQVEETMQDDTTFQSYSFSDDDLLAGFICMDYEGNVKAIVGSRDEKTESRIYNVVTQGTRSPGSCIKPIASYGPAIDQDIITYSTLIQDSPITIEVDGEDTQWPVNYSETGESSNWSNSYIPAWQMLARSLNTAPAQLVDQMTPTYCYNFLIEKLDITTLTDADADYSPMAVGGLTYGLHLEELVGAYMIFGNGGKKYDTTYISKIEEADGDVLYEKSEGYTQAISESSAYVVNKMMQRAVTESNGTARYAKLDNVTLAAKTGTSSEWMDLNFVGCTPEYVSGVWIGYDEQSRISTDKYNNIGLIWKNIFGDIADEEETTDFEQPETVVELSYCTKTGLIAGSNCPTATGYYKETNIPATCSGSH